MKTLNEYKKEYYEGAPALTDSEYDALEKFLDSQEIGYKGKENKTKHLYPMMSLNKMKIDKYKDNPFNSPVIITKKLDGLAMELVYKKVGDLFCFEKAVTRGDGEYGMDVTNSVINLDFPKSFKVSGADVNNEVIAVYGEVVGHKRKFKESADVPENSNPRNLVAGWVMSQEPNLKYTDWIHFVAYGFEAQYYS